jgi:hypothetical protein
MVLVSLLRSLSLSSKRKKKTRLGLSSPIGLSFVTSMRTALCDLPQGADGAPKVDGKASDEGFAFSLCLRAGQGL